MKTVKIMALETAAIACGVVSAVACAIAFVPACLHTFANTAGLACLERARTAPRGKS